MDFEVTYSEEQQRFRQEVRAWLAEHVAPGAARTPVSAEDNYRRYLDLRELGRALGAKGWLFPRAPVTYGGGGLDLDHAVILEEEVDRLDLSLPPYYDLSLIHISEPTRLLSISYAVFCLKKKK